MSFDIAFINFPGYIEHRWAGKSVRNFPHESRDLAFKLGRGWSYQQVLAIGLVNYSYKAVMAIVLTPLIYLLEAGIERYLGPEKTREMKLAAMQKEND